jgi:hypothetical protein
VNDHEPATRTCRRCRQPVVGTFCGRCGAPVATPLARATDRTHAEAPHQQRPRLWLPLALGAMAVLIAVAVVAVSTKRTDDGGIPPTAAPPTESQPAPTSRPSVPVTATATASCSRSNSVDSLGNTISYEPARAVDGDPTTAWRCDGDGVGQFLTVTFSEPVSLSRISIVPGLAKTDPGDGTDRYAQNRRVSQVRLGFDDGGQVDSALDTSPYNRTSQIVALDRTVVTRSVTITILSSTAGQAQRDKAAVESVAISEVSW